MGRDDRRQRVIAGIMVGRRGHSDHSRNGLVWGAIIAAVGVLLLLDHMDFIHVGPLFRFWPMIIVFVGLGHLADASNRIWGAILIIVGVVFQLNSLGITHLHFADLWPLAIIAVGLLLMWAALKPPVLVRGSVEIADDLNAVAIFGGAERRIKTQNFKGGRATSVFGGVELDFRDANIEGDEATLEINCIFGGVEIRVPDNWNVHSMTIPVLGGYSDKTRLSAAPPQDSTNSKQKTLIVTGAIIFGGVEIGN